MNILILHSSSDQYGASKILLGIVQLLTKRNHRVWVVLSEPGPLSADLLQAGADIIYIRLGILRRKYFSPTGIINRLITIRTAKKELEKIIRQENIELVYSNTTGVLAGALAASSCRVKHIWHVHEIIESPQWFKRILGKIMRQYAQTVVVVSEAVKKSWQLVIPENKIIVVHNGIDYSPYLQVIPSIQASFGFPEDALIIGMVGRVHYWKGQDYFIQIAGQLHPQFPQLRFVMVGDAFPGYEYLYAQLDNQIQQLQVQDVVKQLGFRNDIPSIMQSIDLFLLPSQLPDPFPTVILEAMASGKPVIATQMGGALEMIESGITGDFMPADNAEEAANKIANWLNKEKLNTAGLAARQRVLEKFSQEAWENKLIKIIE
jgi:glycosyltransferase involved in cell wall biosynthesis